jgi:CTP:molybdopterin cytidylyltransferase MocA
VAAERFVTGLVPAGGSRRLGAPKQLLPYHGTILLGHEDYEAVLAPGGPS